MVHSCNNRWRNTYRRRIFGYTASITMPPPARARIDFFDSLIMNVLAPHLQNFYSCFEKIAKLSFSFPTKDEIADHFGSLSPREVEIAALLCQGLTFEEIATCLFISRRTVEAHIQHLYDKLNVHDKKTTVEKLTSRFLEK